MALTDLEHRAVTLLRLDGAPVEGGAFDVGVVPTTLCALPDRRSVFALATGSFALRG